MELSNEQLERYSRQIVLKEVGLDGQKKLLKSSVLIVGVGGLGALALAYLSAAGVGTVGIIDYDNVETSNLHRQIIYETNDIGKKKAIVAEEKINKINPNTKVISFSEKLCKENIEDIFKNFEIVLDGLDNFPDKFLVNDYCLKLNKKLVHAGVTGFEGQILTIIPGKSSCLRCYFPYNEPTNQGDNCKDIGVLGPVVGVISSLQCLEVIKLILGIGDLFTDKVLKYDGLKGKFYEFEVKSKNSECQICHEVFAIGNLSKKNHMV